MPALSVFLSSTFRDFQQERDLFLGPIRDRLGELAARHGWRVEVVDLRWGIESADLDEEAAHLRVLDVCLHEVDRCRPLFVGLLGDRFGWVPSAAQAERVRREAGLPEGAGERWSVTALEFAHGALLGASPDATFFLRELDGPPPPGWADDDPAGVAWLRAWTEQASPRVARYRARSDGRRLVDLGGLEDLAVAALGPQVEARVAAARAGGAEGVGQQLFVDDRLRAVAGRDDLVAAVVEEVGAGGRVALAGPPGTGVSTVWCAVVDALRRQGRPVAAHVVAADEGSDRRDAAIRHLSGQLGRAPSGLVDPRLLLGRWREALAAHEGLVIGIDGLEAFADEERGELRLVDVPDGVGLVVTTADATQAAWLGHADVHVVEVRPLGAGAAAEAARARARADGRDLPPSALAVVARRPRSGLWVRLALDALAALGADELDGAADAAAVQALVLRTVEGLPDEDRALAAHVIGLVIRRLGPDLAAPAEAMTAALALSRSGLEPDLLARLAGTTPLAGARVRRALAPFVVTRDVNGRLAFAHPVVREGVVRRVVDPATVRRALADALARVSPRDPVVDGELIWQGLRLGEPEIIRRPLERQAVRTGVEAHSDQVLVDSTIADREGDATTIRTLAALAGRRPRRRLALVVEDEIEAFRAGRTPRPPLAIEVVGAIGSGQGGRLDGAERRRLLDVAEQLARAPEASHGLPNGTAFGLAMVLQLGARVPLEDGDQDRAAAMLDEAAEILRGLLRRPHRRDGRREPAGPITMLAMTVMMRHSIAVAQQDGPRAASLAAERDALVARAEAGERDPETDGWLARVRATQAQPSSSEADPQAALAAAEARVAEGRRLVAAAPDSLDGREVLALALCWWCTALSDLGRPAEARGAIDEAIVLLEGISRSSPGLVHMRALHVEAHLIRAGLWAAVGDAPAARADLDEAVALARAHLVHRASSVEALRQLCTALESRAAAAEADGDGQQSRADEVQVVERRRALVATGVDPVSAARDLSVALDRAARGHLADGQPDEAVAPATEAVALDRAAVDRGSGSGAVTDLALGLRRLRSVHLARGDLASAREAAEAVIALAPGDGPEGLGTRADDLATLGELHEAGDDAEASLAAWTEALTLVREHLPDDGIRIGRLAHDAARAAIAIERDDEGDRLARLGLDARRREATGDGPEALIALTDSLELLLRVLPRRRPERLEAARELVRTYDRLAVVAPGATGVVAPRASARGALWNELVGSVDDPRAVADEALAAARGAAVDALLLHQEDPEDDETRSLAASAVSLEGMSLALVDQDPTPAFARAVALALRPAPDPESVETVLESIDDALGLMGETADRTALTTLRARLLREP